jgi:hypothetical protein
MNEKLFEFVEFPAFSRQLSRVREPEVLLGRIQTELLQHPESGVRLRGGIRKVRVSAPGRAEGKSGGFRVWYYCYQRNETFFLLYLLDKRLASNLSPLQEDTLMRMLHTALSVE